MSLSKRTRFEVFKRDSFTCQYCGKKAPDVVLHCDHVKPRAEGGTDDLLNLVTACDGCNLGKAAIPLSDDSAVTRQRRQLELLQERQEQLAMMVDWQRSLLDLDKEAIVSLEEFWCDASGWYELTETGRQTLRKLLRKFGVAELMTAMRVAISEYFQVGENGEPTSESAERAFNKLSGICSITRAEKDKPYLKDLFYVRAILKNRAQQGTLSYVDITRARTLLETVFELGGDAERVKRIACEATTWSRWQNDMYEYLDDLAPSN